MGHTYSRSAKDTIYIKILWGQIFHGLAPKTGKEFLRDLISRISEPNSRACSRLSHAQSTWKHSHTTDSIHVYGDSLSPVIDEVLV